MKRRFALTLIAALLYAASAFAQPGGEPIERLVERFDTTDSFDRVLAHGQFEKAFPPDQRADALVRLWRAARAAKKQDAQGTVLGYLVTTNGEKVETTPQIMAMLREAAGSPDRRTRGIALNVLARRDPTKSEILRFLKDNDDFLRERAVEEIRVRPDARSRLSSYVALNRRNKKFAKSVERARFFLKQLEQQK